MSTRNWHRIAYEAEQARDNALAQLRYEQANRRQEQANYQAEHQEYLAEVEAAIQRVRDLHRPVAIEERGQDGALVTVGYECDYCGNWDDLALTYPCPTIRALDGGDQ